MGLFSRSKTTTPSFPWNKLESVEQWEALKAKSEEKPVLIFKHSTRCSISIMALNGFERNWDQSKSEIELYYLDLIAFRPVSNQIATDLNVLHQSPQAILLYKGNVLYEATHQGIDARKVQRTPLA